MSLKHEPSAEMEIVVEALNLSISQDIGNYLDQLIKKIELVDRNCGRLLGHCSRLSGRSQDLTHELLFGDRSS